MPKIVITGVPGLDGAYDLDMNFTYRDFRTIKQTAGVRANEVQDALAAGDMDLIIALAEIALRRAGKPHVIDQLLDLPAAEGAITLDATDLEAEVEDPTPPRSSDDDARPEPERTPSGPSTNASTASSQATFPQLGSGTPEQVSGSARLTSTT